MLKEKRIASIDNIKFICIVSMVLCHYGYKNDMLVQFIYGFHMPSLFVISGYLYKKHCWKNDLLVFGVPIILFSILGCLWNYYLFVIHNENETAAVFFQKLTLGFFFTNHGYYHTPFTGIWFIIGLLCMRQILNWVNIEKYGMLLCIVCVLLTECNTQYNFSLYLKEFSLLKPVMIFPFFYCGYILKNRSIKISTIGAVLFFISYIVITFFNGRTDMYDGTYGISYVLVLVGTFIFFVSMCHFLYFPLGHIVKNYSIGTFLILGTHSIGFPYLVGIINRYVHIHNISVLLCLMLFFIVIFPVIKTCNLYCPIVLGKMKKK